MKKALKAVLSFTIATSMLLPLTACSKSGKKKVKVKEDDPYFDATRIKLEFEVDADKEVEYKDIYNFTIIGETIMASYSVNYKIPPELERELKFANPETEEEMQKLMDTYMQYYQSGTITYDLEGNVISIQPADSDSNEYLMSMKEGSNGNLFAMYESYEYDMETGMGEESYTLKEMDPDGKIISEKEIELPEEIYWVDDFYFLDDGSTLFSTYGAIWLSGPDGEVAFTIENEDMMGTLFEFEDKWYGAMYEHNEDYTEMNYFIQELDLKKGEFTGDKIKCDPQLIWSMFQGDDGLYTYNGNGIVKINPIKNEKEMILEWSATDINYANVQGDGMKIYSADKVAFVTTTYNQESYDDWSSETYLTVLTRAEKNPHAGKTLITLGTNGIPSEAFMDYVIDYNTNEDNKARMVINDYSADISYEDDYEKSMAEMADKVYLEMIAGSGPDILVNFSSFSQFNSEDVLLDLNKYIDGKDGLNRDDYFDNVFRAFETRGKLFQIPVCCDIHGLLGNKELIGERTGWTYSEFNQIVSSLPEGVSVFQDTAYDQLLDELLSNSMNSFVDYSKKEVYFDSDEFKQILDIVKTYGVDQPSDMNGMGMSDPYDEYGEYIDPQELLDEGMLAVIDTYIYTLQQYASNSKVCNGNAIFVGTPSSDGSGMAAAPMLTLAIAAKSVNKEEAWDFIQYMYNEDQQFDFSSSYYSIPLSKGAFDRVNQEAIENSAKEVEEYEQMMKDMEEYGGDYYYPDSYAPQILTQEDADGFRKLVESVSTIYSTDPAIMNIITEEAAAYFSGQRSADDVCKNIQDRTTTIVHER